MEQCNWVRMVGVRVALLLHTKRIPPSQAAGGHEDNPAPEECANSLERPY